MKKYISAVMCCILAVCCGVGFASCSADKTEETTVSVTSTTLEQSTEQSQTQTTAVTEETTEATTEQTTTEKDTTSQKAKTTTKYKGETSISVNQALNVLTDMYGSKYDVNGTVQEDEYYYFSVTDKKGNKYASVKVNLKTADAEETITNTGEINKYNLLA